MPRLLGLDSRKMSKSYNNTINLSDSGEVIRKKIANMITDPKRIKLSDPGHPDVCNVFSYHSFFIPEVKEEVKNWCINAQLGCTECKKRMADGLIKKLEPFCQRRRQFVKDREKVVKILAQGKEKALAVSSETLKEVKQAMVLER
jgi:tryptophanyl-tRNA synthetase